MRRKLHRICADLLEPEVDREEVERLRKRFMKLDKVPNLKDKGGLPIATKANIGAHCRPII
jgi:hypothetical protein